MCHVSCVTCHNSLIFSRQSSGASQRRVCYHWGLPSLVFFVHIVFTDSACWAGSVIGSACPFVCMCVTKVVIVDNDQSIRVFSSHKLDPLGVMCHMSCVMYHMSHFFLYFLHFRQSSGTNCWRVCLMSCVMCHVSHVTIL